MGSGIRVVLVVDWLCAIEVVERGRAGARKSYGKRVLRRCVCSDEFG